MKVPKWLGYEPIAGRGQVKRQGVILTATEDHDTPEDRKERIAALAAKVRRNERLFEAGRQPRLLNPSSHEF